MSETSSLTIEEAISESKLSRTFLYGEIGRGRLKARKAGRRTVILRADLGAFLQSLPEARIGRRALERAAA